MAHGVVVAVVFAQMTKIKKKKKTKMKKICLSYGAPK